MRESNIEDETTYLGPFFGQHHKLKVGHIQSMQYQPNNNNPFYLNKQKKEELKFDCQTNNTGTTKFTQAEMVDALKICLNLSNVW